MTIGIALRVLLGLVFAVSAPLTANAASVLIGITGDGGVVPETLYELSQTDASSSFLMTLGNGLDGETIAWNPVQELLYHSSGIDDDDRFWESIDLSMLSIVSSVQFTGVDVFDENLAMTFNPVTGRFLVADRTFNFFDATLGGVATTLGTTFDETKGLAFVGGTLFGGSQAVPELRTLDPLTGATIGTALTVTLAGVTLAGINGLATNPDDSSLWAILREESAMGPGDRYLATLDTTTGVATSMGLLSDRFAGIAFVTAPEPATGALLAIGLLAMLARRRA